MRKKEFPVLSDASVDAQYAVAKEMYATYGIDTDKVIRALAKVAVSMHCWQGDDVGGFESGGELTGGIAVTGNHPGKARNADELRQDAEMAFGLIPGKHRFNLHAIYLQQTQPPTDRDAIGIEQFLEWIDWADSQGIGLDFNPTFFSHPKEQGYTLAHHKKAIRDFWVEHGIRSREIAEQFAKRLKDIVVNNYWIPDGSKDIAIDQAGPRDRLRESYARIFADSIDPRVKEAVESKLFGVGCESYTAGSHEFYLALAIKHQKLLCLDMGHFHPTENIDDKLSAVLPDVPGVLVHASRGVRWDSDHVPRFTDPIIELGQAIVRQKALKKVYLATDYFDASINRVGAWATGQRNVYSGLLYAMLEPTKQLMQLEKTGQGAEKLGLLDVFRSMPYGAVWNKFCSTQGVPVGAAYLNEIRKYEDRVLSKRE